MIKIALFIGCFFFISQSFAQNPDPNQQRKTIYYVPYSLYWVNYDASKPNHTNSVQVMFIGSVESTTCTYGHRYSWNGLISSGFRDHVEAYYKNKLGAKHSRTKDGGGFWRLDSPAEVASFRARMAKRYPRVVLVSDYRFYCK